MNERFVAVSTNVNAGAQDVTSAVKKVTFLETVRQVVEVEDLVVEAEVCTIVFLRSEHSIVVYC